MFGSRKTKNGYVPLIVESHPEDYEGYPFITLVRHKKDLLLAIIDNASDMEINMYVLDLCGPENVDEEQVITVAADWYENNKENYPISVEFSKRGLTSTVGKIYKSYHTDFITRIIGPLPSFDMTEIHSIKRRKKKNVPKGVDINQTKLTFTEF